MASVAVRISREEVIVVDLDGTLVLEDTFILSLLEAIRKDFLNLIPLLLALFCGRAACKKVAADAARLDATYLRYHKPVLEYLRLEKVKGNRLVLATGADVSIAQAVADHTQLFDDVIASDGIKNVTGEHKLHALRTRIGNGPFVYAGNSRSDLKLWRASSSAIVVGAKGKYSGQLSSAGVSVRQRFEGDGWTWASVIQSLRPHQWSKNVLVFVPLVLAHQLLNLAAIRQATIAFLALCCMASALYIANDLLDLQADRRHPRKRFRPLAAGRISVTFGVALSIAMILMAFALSTALSQESAWLLALYAGASLLYSLKLKRILFLDIVTLAVLYALRVDYGGSATGIKISAWTSVFCIFMFASLATVKRLAELRKTDVSLAETERYRGYTQADVTQLSALAAAGAYVTVLVLALYINSPEVALLYKRSHSLLLLCPVLVYWLGRLTLIANRGDLEDDPVAFALKDQVTWIAGVISGIILVLST